MNNEKDTTLSESSVPENPQELIDLTETDTSRENGTTEDFTEAQTKEQAEPTGEIPTTVQENAENDQTADKEPAASPTVWETAPLPIKKSFNGKRLSNVILFITSLTLLLGTAVTTLYYIFYASRNEFHADCTDTIMWANASVESGSLYDSQFTYACFLPFSTSTLMIPLIKIFGFGMTAHTLGMTGFFILLTLFMVLMLREISGNINAALCGTAVFISLTHATQKMREIFWGHTIYYSLGILFLVIGAYLYARLLSLSSKQTRRRKEGADISGIRIHKSLVFLCICAFAFLTGMDGITGITLFAIPFVGGVFAEQFLNPKYKLTSFRTTSTLCRAVIFLSLAVIGNTVNDQLLGSLKSYYTEANSEFSDMDSWIQHFHKLPLAWMRLLGVDDMPDVMFTDDEGIINIINIMTAVVVAVLPIIATLSYKKYGSDFKGRMMRIWVWMHWAVTAVVLMGYICGILSYADWRIVPVIGTSVILSILFVCWSISNGAASARIAALMCVPIIAAGYLNCVKVMKMPKDGYKNNTQYQLVDFLEENGVNCGYSTFWNANSITLLTDGRIKVRDVIADESGVFHRKYQTADRWYKTDPNQKEYFLLLSQPDCDKFRSSEKYQKDKPVRIKTAMIDGVTYTLMIYDHNFVGERNYAF